jgi:hypothetical protein
MQLALDTVKKEYEANAKKIQDLSKKTFKSTIDFQINSSIDKFISEFNSFGSIEFIRDDGIPQTPSKSYHITSLVHSRDQQRQCSRYPKQLCQLSMQVVYFVVISLNE